MVSGLCTVSSTNGFQSGKRVGYGESEKKNMSDVPEHVSCVVWRGFSDAVPQSPVLVSDDMLQ
jgi:hypothetical protein